MPEITSLIPHRPPMLLVDEILSAGPERLVAKKSFRGEEFFLQGHYPDYPIVPGVILLECGFQAGALLIAHRSTAAPAESSPESSPAETATTPASVASSEAPPTGDSGAQVGAEVPVVTRVNDVKFKQMVHPEDTVEIDIKFVEQVANAVFMSARVRRHGKLAASFSFAATLAEQPQ